METRGRKEISEKTNFFWGKKKKPFKFGIDINSKCVERQPKEQTSEDEPEVEFFQYSTLPLAIKTNKLRCKRMNKKLPGERQKDKTKVGKI